MIRYIFHGGETKIKCERNTQFFQELVSSAANGKILIVLSAKSEDQWREQKKIDLARFKKEVPNAFFEIDFADKDPNVFLKQVEAAEVIYFKGGNNYLLKKYLMPIKKELENLFKGKVVVGCSAGVNVVARYYFSTDKQRIENGLDFLSIKAYCHYKNNKNNLEKLENYKESLKIYKIKEADFILVEE